MGLKFASRMAAVALALGAVGTAGQALGQTYGSRVEKVVTYTANGQVQTEADGKNNLTTYEYDGLDRLVKVRYPDPNTPGVSSTTDYEQYGYDAAGNRTTLRKRSGETVTFIYDAMNRVAYHDGVPTWFYYDNLDHPTWGYAGANYAAITVRTYDALGRVTQDYAHLNGTYLPISYQYDAAGNRVRMTWPDGFYVTYDRDNTGAVTAIRENGSTVLASYAYDDLGRRTATSLGNGANSQYGYDNASRLNSLSLYLADPAKRQTYSLTYNAASQVASRTASNDLYEWADLQASKTYVVNGLNQYTSVAGGAAGYDARGNMTNNGAATYGYDLENRLTSASGGATLSYDPIGRLQEIAKPGYQTERLAYDGPNLVTEYDTANTILRRYVPGPGVDEPVVWYEGAGTSDRRYYLRDMQGSIISVSNNAGTAIKTYTYDEYGVPGGVLGGDTDGRFRYTGQTWLPQVGLYHYKARVYSPTLGRFLQTDPIGYGDGLNWYAYVGNDPLNQSDPTGMVACPTCVEEVVVVGTSNAERLAARMAMENLLRGAVRFTGSAAFKVAGSWANVGWEVVKPSELGDGTICGGSNPSSFCMGSEEHPYETPTTNIDKFVRTGKGPETRWKNKDDKSIWQKDVTRHGGHRNADGGSEWKRWPNERAYQRDVGKQSVWPNGVVRK